MNLDHIVSVACRSAARAALEGVPSHVLRSYGLRRSGAATLVFTFALGAAAGLGVLLLVAPGRTELRRAIASRARHARNRVIDLATDVEDGLIAARARLAADLSGHPVSPSAHEASPALG
jgi:hypothetical protein